MLCSEFLTLAQLLAGNPDEASQRSAVSRAYYAAYHHCLEWHGQLPAPGNNVGPEGGKHQTLINQLTHPAPEVPSALKMKSKSLGYKLNELRLARVKADYKLQDGPETYEVLRAVADAHTMLN